MKVVHKLMGNWNSRETGVGAGMEKEWKLAKIIVIHWILYQ